ncbi:MAG: tetratricopeptide repeat protein [Gemmatimonadetes bacterium]|nr:tetratricopeptide repeat protein [Gemmatimonadota bacterium]MYK54457.1 tetratricopeptide repeat protein [Gemmatimonadota bacterium]
MSNLSRKSFPITQHVTALICFFLSGFAGLVYEVAWIRQAALLFGSTTFAVSAVLSVFFLGLAIGAYLFGRVGQRTFRPLILFAYIEIGLGLLALISPFAFDFADFLYGIAYRLLSDAPFLRFTTRLLLVALVVLPPTVLMGGTLPLFCRQYSRDSGTIARAVGLLYGVNTLGAALGCAATGFVFLPDLGLRGAIYIGVVCNILSGVVVRALSIAREDVFPDSAQSRGVSGGLPRSSVVFVLFFAIGFVALGAEVLWVRYLGLLINNTVYTYTLTLGVVLVGLVLGSVLASLFSDRTERRAYYFGAFQVATGLVVLALLMLSPGAWRGLGNDLYIYFVVLLPPAVLSGAAFPLAIRLVIRNAEYTSGMAGNLIAVNTLGGILGSLLIGFVGIPFFGLEKSLFFITGANLAIGISAWFLLDGRYRVFKYAAALVAILVYLGIPYFSQTQVPADFIGEGRDLVAFREGYGANMAVVRREDDLELEIDRWWQGGSKKNHQIMAAHVPMLLHPNPKRVVVVGAGTGQTVSRFLMYPIDYLACVDIEPALFPFIEEHFETDWMGDSRVEIIAEDGRNFLRHTAATYDIISLELGEVSRPGVAFFYTVDFYARARERLAPGGYLVQFVPLRFLTEDQFRGVVRSFLTVFPQSILWYNTSELLLIGSVDDAFKIAEGKLLGMDEEVHADLQYSHWGGVAYSLNQPHVFWGGYLMGAEGLASATVEADVYWDDRPVLDYESVQHAESDELAFAEILYKYRDSIDALMPGEADARIAEVQNKNLREIAARVFVREASDLIPAREHRRIATLCAEAIRRLPEYVDAHRMFADAMMQLGRLQDAERHYARVLELDPTDARALNGRAVAFHRAGRLVEAVRYYEDAIRYYPNNALSQNGIAMALHRLGRFDEAIQHYKDAIRLHPDRPDTYADLGTALAQAGRLREAVPYLEKALALRPNFTRVQRVLAQIRREVGSEK